MNICVSWLVDNCVAHPAYPCRLKRPLIYVYITFLQTWTDNARRVQTWFESSTAPWRIWTLYVTLAAAKPWTSATPICTTVERGGWKNCGGGPLSRTEMSIEYSRVPDCKHVPGRTL